MKAPLLALAAAALAGCAAGPPVVLRAAPPVSDPYALVGPVGSATVVRRFPAEAPERAADAAEELVLLGGFRLSDVVQVTPPTPELQPHLMELGRAALDLRGSPEQVALLERFLRDRERFVGHGAVLSVSLERFAPDALPTVVAQSRLHGRDVLVVEPPLEPAILGERIADAAATVHDGELAELEGPIEVLGVQWFRVQRGPRSSLGLDAVARVAWTDEDPLAPTVVALRASYRADWDEPELRFTGRAVLRPGEEMWLFERTAEDEGIWVLRASWMNKAAWEQLVVQWQDERSWQRRR